MHLGGQGLLQARFEELKKKLQSEGLFDTRFKKPIPKMPGTIGVITSSTGAAFQDICNVLSRRFPVQVKLFHATVQGENAPKELISGLHYFNITKSVDVIIIGRGGGSQEDLFCFNDEGLARAVFASEIPVISAVGHEIDFTICDFVSDLRAPTPSAAAEIAVPDKTEFINKLQVYSKHLKNSCLFRLSRMRNILSESDRRMQRNHPERIIFAQQQYLDQMSSRLQLSIKRIGLKKDKLNNLYKKLEAQHPRNIIFNRVKVLNEYSLSLLKVKDLIRHRQVRLQKLQQRLESNLQEFSRVKVSRNRERLYKNGALLERSLPDYLNRMKSLLDNYQALIREYSPKRAMEKGYALIRKEKKLITSVKDLKINDKLSLDFKDGNAECLIEKISYE
jgi:exodeoxyribonuclease VII large subunit